MASASQRPPDAPVLAARRACAAQVLGVRLGLTLRRHPLALLRPRLEHRRLLSAAQLQGVADGRMASVPTIRRPVAFRVPPRGTVVCQQQRAARLREGDHAALHQAQRRLGDRLRCEHLEQARIRCGADGGRRLPRAAPGTRPALLAQPACGGTGAPASPADRACRAPSAAPRRSPRPHSPKAASSRSGSAAVVCRIGSCSPRPSANARQKCSRCARRGRAAGPGRSAAPSPSAQRVRPRATGPTAHSRVRQAGVFSCMTTSWRRPISLCTGAVAYGYPGLMEEVHGCVTSMSSSSSAVHPDLLSGRAVPRAADPNSAIRATP